jgi:Lrp/AsnC family leucine-responsive transcriptional regulator
MAFDSESALDDTGWRLLRAVQEDSRLSFSELGRRIGLSAPAVAERVRRMEEAGILVGYHARIDTTRLGFPITAFIQIRAPAERYGRIATLVRTLSEVVECHHLTGEDSFLIKVIAASMVHLEAVITELRQHGETDSKIVMSTLVSGKMVYGGPSVRVAGA